MPIPNNDPGLPGRGSTNNVSTGNKTTRIDFSPSLDSIDPKCPQSPVASNNDVSAWDTETGTLLVTHLRSSQLQVLFLIYSLLFRSYKRPYFIVFSWWGCSYGFSRRTWFYFGTASCWTRLVEGQRSRWRFRSHLYPSDTSCTILLAR